MIMKILVGVARCLSCKDKTARRFFKQKYQNNQNKSWTHLMIEEKIREAMALKLVETL